MHPSTHSYIHLLIHTKNYKKNTMKNPCINTYIHTCMHPYKKPCIHTSMHPYKNPCIHTSIQDWGRGRRSSLRGKAARVRGRRPRWGRGGAGGVGWGVAREERREVREEETVGRVKCPTNLYWVSVGAALGKGTNPRYRVYTFSEIYAQ